MSTSPPPGQEPHDPRDPQGGYPPPAGYPGSDQPPAGYPPDYSWPGYPQPGYPQPGYPQYPGGSSPATPPEDPLVPPDFSGWYHRIVGVVRRSFRSLLILQAGSAVAQLGIAAATGDLRITGSVDATTGEESVSWSSVAGWLVSVVVTMIVYAASVDLVIRDASGEPTTIGSALRFATGRAMPLIGWGALVGLLFLIIGFVLGSMFAVSPVLGVLGLFALVLPFLYLLIVMTASFLGTVVVERSGIVRLFALVNSRFLPTAGRVVTFFLISGMYLLVIFTLTGFVMAGIIDVGSVGSPSTGIVIVFGLLVVLLDIPVSIAFLALTVVTYAELRFHDRPGTLTPQLVAELRR